MVYFCPYCEIEKLKKVIEADDEVCTAIADEYLGSNAQFRQTYSNINQGKRIGCAYYGNLLCEENNVCRKNK